MANGTDSEEFVVLSKVRTGLKREFAFALKFQSQISTSTGRTRGRKAQSGVSGNVVSESSSTKRLKGLDSNAEDDGAEKLVNNEVVRKEEVGVSEDEEEVKSDVVDSISDDEKKNIVREEINNDVIDVVSDEEPRSNLVESPTIEELKIDALQTMQEDEPKVDQVNPEKFIVSNEPKREKAESLREGGNNDEISPLLDEKPFRRFTRSALAPKANAGETALPVKLIGDGEDVIEEKNVDSSLLVTPPKGSEIVLKHNLLKKFPSKLKDFLGTGILEGLAVTYVRGSKLRGHTASGLQGVIKGSGILCFCKSCQGNEVVSPNQFELHAGSSNKRPPEYIYLENGNTLRDIMNACKNVTYDKLEEALLMSTGGSSVKTSNICLYCRGSISVAGSANSKLICNLCLELKNPQASAAKTAQTNYSGDRFKSPQASATQAAQTNYIGDRPGGSVSVPKAPGNMSNGSSSRSKSQGRITKKDLRLHKLVFEEDFLPEGTAVTYFVRGQKFLTGSFQRSGILCNCCNSVVSPSQFEAHAGFASRRKPFHNIFISNGASLHELAVSLSMGRKLSTNDNDDLCTICADGGDLLCCDGCPRAFHKECVPLPILPTGKWYCKNCENNYQKEKFERNANAIAAGRVAGTDPIEQINQRFIRIVKSPELDSGGCALCRAHDFNKSEFGPRTVIICDQCEKEYHVGCLKEHGIQDLKELPPGKWFCCEDCSRIHSVMQNLVDHGGEDLPEAVLTALKQKHEEGSDGISAFNVRWRLIKGKMATDESRVLLQKVVAIFRDNFGLIPDTTSSCDLIPKMVYGKSIKGRDFGGMYCALLTVNSVVVSAGIVRIFGPEFAELPLAATSKDCQGKGYFQSLYSCIEGLLGSLNVKELVVPATSEAESIWTDKFGFSRITKAELNEYTKHHDLMVFEAISWLRKSVPPCHITA